MLGYASLVVGAALLVVAIAARGDLAKVDVSRGLSRDAWQLPEQVIASLGIPKGATVADVGAGEGYFTLALSAAVGPSGRVFAVEVDEEALDVLRDTVAGRKNITVIHGEYADPLLPDGTVDLVFVCNTFHHIEQRVTYFEHIQRDLASGGRVAIIDLKDSLLVTLTGHPGHATPLATLMREMTSAGYREVERFDFLALQHFVIFAPME
jgi:ubiquinone/menaquinone biosynthesis C-methylase UbiE